MSKADTDRANVAIPDGTCDTALRSRPGPGSLVPGLLLAVLSTLASAYLSDHYGPLVLLAIVATVILIVSVIALVLAAAAASILFH